MLKSIEEYIEEIGGYEEWKKKCLADEKDHIERIEERYFKLPFNDPVVIDFEEMNKFQICNLMVQMNRDYSFYFTTAQILSLLKFHQRLVTFLQLNLLDDVESETELTADVIFRALENYVKLKKEKTDESTGNPIQ
jgi:hypothetical protein